MEDKTELAERGPSITQQNSVQETLPNSNESENSQNAEKSAEITMPVVTPSQHRRIFKIIVIGDSNVGKTCLTYRFCGGKFLDRSEATIGVDFREKTVQIDDELIKLQIWDTGILAEINVFMFYIFIFYIKKNIIKAGQERFRKSMISHYYRNVHAVLFVYDVTNVSSFENLTFWIDEYNKHCRTNDASSQIPKILVGNKCDLDSDSKVF